MIVFCSGFLVPQRIGTFEYFRGGRKAFPGAVFPQVPPLGDVKSRAQALAASIKDLAGPIHLVAHSMGGLHARYMPSKNLEGTGGPGRVASLATLSTPHRGSPIADLLVGPQPSVFDLRPFAYAAWQAFATLFDLPTGALGDLTTAAAAALNASCPDLPHVRYLSYA